MRVLRTLAKRKAPSMVVRRHLVKHIQSRLGGRELASWSRWYANLENNPRFRLYASVMNAIEKGTFPRLHAIETLRFAGGLTVGAIYAALGANPEILPLMNVALNSNRTRPVPNHVYLSNTLVWLPSRVATLESPYDTMPLSEIVKTWTRQPVANLATWRRQHCLYAQIGFEDGGSFPAFPPGAFIQIDPSFTTINGTTDPNYYFVRHPFGYSCCQCAVEQERIFLLTCSSLFPQLEFENPGAVHVIGRVRAFCSRIEGVTAPHAIGLQDLEHRRRQAESSTTSARGSLTGSQLLHLQRLCLGITYAQLDHAAERLRGVATNWEQFRISGGHAHKIEHHSQHVPSVRTLFPLLGFYGLDLLEALTAYGLSRDDSHMIELPGLFGNCTMTELAMAVGSSPSRSGFATAVLDRWLELPALLFHLGSDVRSSKIYFYAGEELEPMINPGSFLLVDDTRADIPARFQPNQDLGQWQRPLFLFQLSNGRFVAGYAERDGTGVHIIPHPGSRHQRMVTIANKTEGTAIGRIVAAASVL